MIESSKLSKRDQKHSKILQKQLQDLHRDVQAMNRRSGANNNDSDQEYQFVDKKGKKWWGRFDERHFCEVYQQQYLQIRDITTSNRILQISPKQPSSLSSYSQERIVGDYDLFAERSLIHVLYKSPSPLFYALTSYQLQQAIPSYSESKKQKEEGVRFRVIPTNHNIQADNINIKELKLSLVGINDDLDFCRLVEDHKKALDQYCNLSEIERQLLLWNQELCSINLQNNRGWDQLIKSIKEEVKYVVVPQSQILQIKEYLMWVTVLKYFQHGHSDKTMEMLAILIQNQKLLRPSKSTNDSSNKKLFQTDCKICFCSFNNESNQVLYCDSCNTSFHLACYGLQEIPKEDTYYCDRCRFEKKNNCKKVMCQICNKTNFPIKMLDGHFYHVTCLLLLNFAHISQGALKLRDGINHSKIVQRVIDNQINQRSCQFCAKTQASDIGYRLKCSFSGCSNCAHPICAYINGCKYSIRRDKRNQKLEVSFTCNAHDVQRNWIQQTYIRRYMCNLKGTSTKQFQQFQKQYQDEIESKHQSKNKRKRWDKSRIINKTGFIKKMLRKEETKNSQQQKYVTQSGRLLQQLKRAK